MSVIGTVFLSESLIQGKTFRDGLQRDHSGSTATCSGPHEPLSKTLLPSPYTYHKWRKLYGPLIIWLFSEMNILNIPVWIKCIFPYYLSKSECFDWLMRSWSILLSSNILPQKNSGSVSSLGAEALQRAGESTKKNYNKNLTTAVEINLTGGITTKRKGVLRRLPGTAQLVWQASDVS